jgi:antitoxin (DNA-binding transcriptional repressor) of toxin-antitoxin stability system
MVVDIESNPTLAELVELVERGEDVLIARAGVIVVRVLALPPDEPPVRTEDIG